mgnify:CR=1 FL=1
MIEWELEVKSIEQQSDMWMVITFTNNKQVTMRIEEWKCIGKPSQGDLVVMTVGSKQ